MVAATFDLVAAVLSLAFVVLSLVVFSLVAVALSFAAAARFAVVFTADVCCGCRGLFVTGPDSILLASSLTTGAPRLRGDVTDEPRALLVALVSLLLSFLASLAEAPAPADLVFVRLTRAAADVRCCDVDAAVAFIALLTPAVVAARRLFAPTDDDGLFSLFCCGDDLAAVRVTKSVSLLCAFVAALRPTPPPPRGLAAIAAALMGLDCCEPAEESRFLLLTDPALQARKTQHSQLVRRMPSCQFIL